MSRMIFELTDEDRLVLERVRIRFGCRSHSETLRELIRGAGGERAAAKPPPPPITPLSTTTSAPKPSFSHGRSKTSVVTPKRERADVQIGPRRPAPGTLLAKTR